MPKLNLFFFPYLIVVAMVGMIACMLLYDPSGWGDIPLLGHLLLLPFYACMLLGMVWFFVSIPSWFKR